MPNIVSLLLLIALFGLSFFVFMMIPFRRKKFKVIFVSVLVAFVIVMFFLPSSLICSIHLPIINSTIHDFAIEFLDKSEHLPKFNEYAGGVYDEMIPLIEDVVKASFVFIVVSISLILASVVSFIMHLFFKKKQLLRTSLFSTLTLVMAVIILVIPTFNVYILEDTMENQLAKDGETLYESHPEYLEYKEIFDLIEKIGIIETETIIDDIPVSILSLYSRGSGKALLEDLRKIDVFMQMLDQSGIPVIFENHNFDFSMTQESTFDFAKLDMLVALVNESLVYKDVARAFVNDIMIDFEQIVEDEFNLGKDIDLQFTSEEFKTQYKEIIKMLDFVVKHDLIRFLNLNQSELNDSIASAIGLLKDIPELVEIINSKFLKKMADGLADRTLVAVKLCIRLYTAMNKWLERYKASDMYQICSDFLEMKGVY